MATRVGARSRRSEGRPQPPFHSALLAGESCLPHPRSLTGKQFVEAHVARLPWRTRSERAMIVRGAPRTTSWSGENPLRFSNASSSRHRPGTDRARRPSLCSGGGRKLGLDPADNRRSEQGQAAQA